jgi:hypothetical protein
MSDVCEHSLNGIYVLYSVDCFAIFLPKRTITDLLYHMYNDAKKHP